MSFEKKIMAKRRATAERKGLTLSRRFLIVSCLATAAASGLIAFTNVASAKVGDKKSKAVTSSQQSPAVDGNSYAKAFAGKGATACAARINQVTNFLSLGNPTGAFLFLPGAKPNQQLGSVSMEMVDKDKKSVYESASFAPGQVDGCEAVYDQVTWWPKKCEEVASSQFGGKKIVGNLKQNIGILEIGPAARVFLMPTSDGCISIKKEVVSQ